MQQLFNRDEAVWSLFDGRSKNYFGINYANNRSSDIVPGDPAATVTTGERIRYDWRGVAELAPGDNLIVGAEQQTDRMDTTGFSAENGNKAGFVVLFDLGLGTLQVDICIRSRDAALVTALRGFVGASVFTPGNDAMRLIMTANPHRVFISRVGRAEVFQPIPPPGGRSPDGPHGCAQQMARSLRPARAAEPR